MRYSIITVNYNNKMGLIRTIESVEKQTCKDYEYIIIDGGSDDGSVEVMKKYKKNITYCVSEPDKGIYNAMNKGILKSVGEYLIFMNSGDCFHDECVLEDMSIAGEGDILLGRVANVDTGGNVWSYNQEAETISMYHFFISTFPHQGCFIKRVLFEEHLYDETLKIVADWKLFMEWVVFKGCTVLQSRRIITDCEPRGASLNASELQIEKDRILKEVIPYGIYKDYQYWSRFGVSTYADIAYVSHYPFLRKILSHILKLMVYLHRQKK